MRKRKSAIRALLWTLVLAGHAAPLGAQTPPPTGGGGERPGEARGDLIDKRRCYTEHENAQLARQAGRLRDARAALAICSRSVCPNVVQTDCVEWLGQVTRSQPTVVLSARVGKRDEFEVRVFIDGQPLVSHLDGKAIPVDPGGHTFRFEFPPHPPIEEPVLISEGEKERVVSVTFDEAKDARAANPGYARTALVGTTTEDYRPVPKLVYVLGAVAAVGIGSFAYFGVTAKEERKNLLQSCAPFCPQSDVDGVHTKYVVADISLGVALASALAAAWLYATRPSLPPPRGSTGLGFAPYADGASLVYRGGF